MVTGFGDETFNTWSNKNIYKLRNTSGKILAVKTIKIWTQEKDAENPFLSLSYVLNCEHKMLPAEEIEVACYHDNVTNELKEAFNAQYKEFQDAGTRLGGWGIGDVAVLETD